LITYLDNKDLAEIKKVETHSDEQIVKVVKENVRFQVFTVVTTKNAIFWDVTPCGSCMN
jgi:hypothetical protein